MHRHRKWLCAVLCFSHLVATTRAEGTPPPAVPAEVQQLTGKRVQIYHDVDLLGTGKPSLLHTGYLAMILQQAGATVARDSLDGKKPDVVIFGDPVEPPQ